MCSQRVPSNVDGEADGHRPPSHRHEPTSALPAIKRIAPPRPAPRVKHINDDTLTPDEDSPDTHTTPLTKIALRDSGSNVEMEVPRLNGDISSPGGSTSDDPGFESFHGANFASLMGHWQT